MAGPRRSRRRCRTVGAAAPQPAGAAADPSILRTQGVRVDMDADELSGGSGEEEEVEDLLAALEVGDDSDAGAD